MSLDPKVFHVEQCQECGLPHEGNGGPRKPYRRDSTRCPMCGGERETTRGYCRECKAQYARGHNPAYRTEQSRKRNAAAAYLVMYIKRGLVARRACEVPRLDRTVGQIRYFKNCSAQASAFQPDHDRPLLRVWVCKEHRRQIEDGVIELPNPREDWDGPKAKDGRGPRVVRR